VGTVAESRQRLSNASKKVRIPRFVEAIVIARFAQVIELEKRRSGKAKRLSGKLEKRAVGLSEKLLIKSSLRMQQQRTDTLFDPTNGQ
jgi:glucose-6-phosphate dehydrogenase assembly protein OpcA